MGGIGGPEVFLILLVVLLVFGPKRIPDVARGIGKGLREFRRLSTEFQREINLAEALEGKKDVRRPGVPPSPPRGGPAPHRPEGAAPPSGEGEGAPKGASWPVPRDPAQEGPAREGSGGPPDGAAPRADEPPTPPAGR